MLVGKWSVISLEKKTVYSLENFGCPAQPCGLYVVDTGHHLGVGGGAGSLSMTCPISSVIQGHLSSTCRLNLRVQTSRKFGKKEGVN